MLSYIVVIFSFYCFIHCYFSFLFHSSFLLCMMLILFGFHSTPNLVVDMLQLTSKGSEVPYILLVYEADEFCNLVVSDILKDRISRVQNYYPTYTICFLTNKLLAYINKRWGHITVKIFNSFSFFVCMRACNSSITLFFCSFDGGVHFAAYQLLSVFLPISTLYYVYSLVPLNITTY